MIERRTFIAGLGSAATWPVVARAQQPLPVVGFLSLDPPRPNASYVVAFRQGLAAAGFVEGRTVAIEYRWANYQGARLAPLAAELVQRKVAVIVAIDSGMAGRGAGAEVGGAGDWIALQRDTRPVGCAVGGLIHAGAEGGRLQ